MSLTSSRYHKDKIYIPRDIKEELDIQEGDRIEFTVTGKKEASIKINGSEEAKKRLLALLEDPPNMGRVIGSLRREDIYDDRD